MKIKLSYFKASGKWYSDGEYETKCDFGYETWDEVRRMITQRHLPGLVDGCSEFIVLITLPEYAGLQHLLFPDRE